ncbi:MAG: PspC domain-containing protein [Nocardioides sp.]|uniref:PspC domain-containing protein n=1 Tax=Nocardioides sp. TaxID=35761 RepID=UPI0039E49556
MTATTLSRPRQGRWIAGVCAGLARRFGLDPNVVRIIAVVSCLLPGPQFIAYIVLWLLMPEDDTA